MKNKNGELFPKPQRDTIIEKPTLFKPSVAKSSLYYADSPEEDSSNLNVDSINDIEKLKKLKVDFNPKKIILKPPIDATLNTPNIKNKKIPSILQKKVNNKYELDWDLIDSINDHPITQAVKLIDPTGVSSYLDAYKAYTDGELNYKDFTETLGALPVLGKIGKSIKSFENIGGVNKIIDKVDNLTGGNLALMKTIDEPVEKITSNMLKKIVKSNKRNKVDTVTQSVNIGNRLTNTENFFALGGVATDPLNDYLMIQKQRETSNPLYLGDPNEKLSLHNINMAKAQQKVENNPWTKGLDMLGGFAMNAGMNAINQSGSKYAGLINGGIQGAGMLASGGFFETGGLVQGEVPINAEGGEIIETPNGQPKELVGPSHSKGGININVPSGTEIYSKRLKGPDGKSMADRKKYREAQIKKLENLATKNPADKNIKTALTKTKKDFALQEQQDMQKMQMMHQMTELKGAMEHFASGGKAGESLPVLDYYKNNRPYFMDNPGNIQGNNVFNYPYTKFPKPPISNTENEPINIPTKDTVNTQNPFSSDSADSEAKKTDGFWGNLGKATNNAIGNTAMGDVVGLAGQLYSTFAPMKNTLANRAGDTPNINAYKNYGKEGLKSLDNSKSYIKNITDEGLKDLQLARAGQINRGRNSARGINTQRALSLATDATVNDSIGKQYSNYAQIMSGIYDKQAQMENHRDKIVMEGESTRDENDRRDRDAFNSQYAKNIDSKGLGLQNLGKNFNDIKERNIKLDHLNGMNPDFEFEGYSSTVRKKLSNNVNNNQKFYSEINADTRKQIYPKIASGEWGISGSTLYDVKTGKVIPLPKSTVSTPETK